MIRSFLCMDETAIQVALDELKKNPQSKPKRPTYPEKARQTS